MCKWHFKTKQGIKNLTGEEAEDMLAGEDADYSQRDLFHAIEKGDFPKWRVCDPGHARGRGGKPIHRIPSI